MEVFQIMLDTRLSLNSQTDFTDIILLGRKQSNLRINNVLITIVVQTTAILFV